VKKHVDDCHEDENEDSAGVGRQERHDDNPGKGEAGEITRLLRAAHDGGQGAAASVMPMVYDDLKKIARNQLARWRPGQTLNTTALVHEGYAKLEGAAALEW